jgi:23S rRNA (cytidine1920-2'-O)/16S rRNA (cytidine1409-2'-O)-methyltransferase
MKKRLDLRVMELRGFSRAYAKEVIKAGLVLVSGRAETRPGALVFSENVLVTAPDMPYVSRGGYKLESALKSFGIVVSGFTCLDIGASTGGFTDCLLKSGAAKVYAADVGHGQLAEPLRGDPRVVGMDGVHAKDLVLPEAVDFIVCDVSFISVRKIIPYVKPLLKQGGGFVCLVKPQFETERRYIGKRGVVKDKKIHAMAVASARAALLENGFGSINIMESPITGGDGNVEYIIYAK